MVDIRQGHLLDISYLIAIGNVVANPTTAINQLTFNLIYPNIEILNATGQVSIWRKLITR